MGKRLGASRQKRWRRLRFAFIGAAGAVSLSCAWVCGVASLLFHKLPRPVLDHYAIAELASPSQVARSARIPHMMSDALIAVEDRNFALHHGVDWQALRRALREDVQSLSYSHGGSTITMQAVRYIALPYDKAIARKVAEIELAMDLVREVPKPEILLLYFDSVSFGLHAAGLESAAKIYFNKRPERLSLAECAFLVGAISHPPAYTSQVTPEFAKARVWPVLAHMESLSRDKYSSGGV